jgi:hypothetical protein
MSAAFFRIAYAVVILTRDQVLADAEVLKGTLVWAPRLSVGTLTSPRLLVSVRYPAITISGIYYLAWVSSGSDRGDRDGWRDGCCSRDGGYHADDERSFASN